MKQITKKIIEEIYHMDQCDLVAVNNLYCSEILNNPDSEIFTNDEEFFELLNWSGLRVAQAIHFGDYNYIHDWVTFDGYGNLKSFSFVMPDYLCDLVETIAEAIAENLSLFEHLFSEELQNLITEEQ